MTSFTIRGVEITEDVKGAMLLAGLRIERAIGRRLTNDETDVLILAVVERLAERSKRNLH